MQRYVITEEDMNKILPLLGEVKFQDVQQILSVLRSKPMEDKKEKKDAQNKK